MPDRYGRVFEVVDLVGVIPSLSITRRDAQRARHDVLSAWYCGIGAADPWASSLAAMAPDDATDAAARHHCYELAIGASDLRGYLLTNDVENLRIAQRSLGEILQRGELRVR